jgi:purine nucleosidase/pyrimidine-specific ribonucleoside hydrolase
MPAPIRVVLDCDPGHDDAMAILLAAASPAIRLEAITTVAGNQTLEKVTLNARRVCSVAGIRDVPIAAGCDRPLEGDAIVASEIHGASGLDGPDWDDVSVDLDERHAVDVIAELAASGPLTVVATAPLTNVATALRRDPGLAARLQRVVVMGGAVGLGNWTPSAEFNIYADPEAAQAVIDSGVPVTLVPLEVTHRALATPEVRERIGELGTRVARLSVELMEYFAHTYLRVFRFPHPPVHDAVAMAAVIDPGVVSSVPTNVRIDLASSLSRGRTVCDVYRMSGLPPNVDLGVDLDPNRFWELMIGAIATYR